MTAPLPVDIYTRISALGDRDEHNLRSPEDQADIARRHLEALGLRAGMTFTDVRSGGTLKRRGLVNAIERIEQGKSAGIAAAFFDRLTRDTKGGRDLLERIALAGGEVYAPDLPPDMKSPQGGLQIDLMLAFSTYLRRTTAERVAGARARAIAEGIPTTSPPIGYYRGEDRKLHPDPKTAFLVRQAFQRRLRGDGMTEIAAWLTDHGVRTSQGNRITLNAVRWMLSNRSYLGEIRSGEYVNPAAHEPLIDVETWNAVNAIGNVPPEKRGRPNRKHFYLLSGSIFCGSCGAAMIGSTGGSGGRRRVYRCVGRKPQSPCGNRARIDAEFIEQEAVRHFLTAEGDLRGRPRVSRPQLDVLERTLATTERRLEQALRPEVQDALGAEWPAFVKARRQERDEASAALGAARNIDPAQDELVTLRGLWEQGGRLSDEDKRRLIHARFPDIRVTKIGRGKRLVSLDPAFTPFVG